MSNTTVATLLQQLPEETEITSKSAGNVWYLLVLLPAAAGVGFAVYQIDDMWLKVFMGVIAAVFAVGIAINLGNIFNRGPQLILSAKGIQQGSTFYPWEKIRDASVNKATDRERDITKHFLIMVYYESKTSMGRNEIDIDDLDIEPGELANLLALYKVKEA